MIRSMTGFGKAASDLDGQQISVEVSSVNHRFLDCFLRMPPAWNSLEPVLKQTIRQHLSRGKLNVVINRKRIKTPPQTVRLNAGLAEQYVEAAKELAPLVGGYETLNLNTLLQFEGVFYQEEPEEDLEAIQGAILQTLEAALKDLEQMRATEGKSLSEDVLQRVRLLRETLEQIEIRLPELNQLYEERLRSRIHELLGENSLSEERIGIEVALLADKGDVTEEVVRLKTHLEHAEELMDSSEPVGRHLDFLAQEIQREINTLGVKTRDTDVSRHVLAMKAELEKIREQVQNIE
ncbi:MAG: YicC family protein [Candidatus Hydrogenedentes bacterium]|nr:YicC family protein [Candidatus Hydrogenedentota bacterium]